MEPERCQHLLSLSLAVEAAASKHKAFSEMLETCDSDIFIAIPGLAVLKSLTHDEETSICRRFLPSMYTEGEECQRKYAELKGLYLKLKTRICGGADFIIRSGSGGQKQRSQSRDISRKSFSQVDDFHSDLEALVLGQCTAKEAAHSVTEVEEGLQRVLMLVRHLGMELQRHTPAEWNEFMSAAIAGCTAS